MTYQLARTQKWFCTHIEKSKHTLKAKTEKELKNVKSWVASNKLSLNFDKAHCMLYTNKSKPQHHDFALDIGGKNCFQKLHLSI